MRTRGSQGTRSTKLPSAARLDGREVVVAASEAAKPPAVDTFGMGDQRRRIEFMPVGGTTADGDAPGTLFERGG